MKRPKFWLLKALGWLAGDPEEALQRFLDQFGIWMRPACGQRRGVPEMGVAVLDFLLGNEDLLLGFCESAAIKPGALHLARHRLGLEPPDALWASIWAAPRPRSWRWTRGWQQWRCAGGCATPKDYDCHCCAAVAELVAAPKPNPGRAAASAWRFRARESSGTDLIKNANTTWLNGKPLRRDLEQHAGARRAAGQ